MTDNHIVEHFKFVRAARLDKLIRLRRWSPQYAEMGLGQIGPTDNPIAQPGPTNVVAQAKESGFILTLVEFILNPGVSLQASSILRKFNFRIRRFLSVNKFCVTGPQADLVLKDLLALNGPSLVASLLLVGDCMVGGPVQAQICKWLHRSTVIFYPLRTKG